MPYLAKIMPASDISMDDINKAGGVSAIINELTSIPGAIHPDRPTVAGVTMGELVKDYHITNDQVIRTKDNPYSAVGGLSVYSVTSHLMALLLK